LVTALPAATGNAESETSLSQGERAMKQLAKVSLAIAAIAASGWGSVVAITACSSSSDNSSSSSSGGGSSGSSSSGAGSSSSSGGSSSGSCMLPSSFGNINTGTCPECATCVQPYCCDSISNCYADPGCNALINCEFGCYNGSLPGDAAVPDGGDCYTLCSSGLVDAGATAKVLYTAEYNCWENGGAGANMCANTCNNCGSTPGEGGPGDDGGDATTSDATTGGDAASDATTDAGGGG
jgi:hypothetical protein